MNYITINPELTSSITLFGYMYDKTTNIFVSSNEPLNFTELTAVDHFSTSQRVSAICPSFTGLQINTYEIIDPNRLVVYLHNISGNGLMDIIWYNKAGYTKLSDENYLYAFPLALQLRALDGSLLFTINDDPLNRI